MENNNKQDLFSLNGKVIVVTGGTGILGESFVNILAHHGATVIILGRNKKVADERVKTIIATGGKAYAAICDVLDAKSLEHAKAEIVNKYGAIHGLVNAAGGNMPGGVLDP
ncbi:NAD(P)-dependent dehydrogenase (short-subunit alcohol dehydrogenase family) [Pedobacter sp. UYP30]|uniref:SDR family NAD(P)-dependent oxidoreductase n=1 Tax=Pedobacter sp. UYP30 TaxID=1756400 RepID=UPI003394518C